jgi:general secretion pathway protein A
MYHQFYGVVESPFALTPDPKYLFLSEAHKEALASIIYGVKEQKGFVLITGEVGTGKTTLIRHILKQFETRIRSVFIFNSISSLEELLQMVLQDLELPYQHRSRFEMITILNEYLLREMEAGRYVVFILDEAQHLSISLFEEIRLLSNLETAHSKLLQIILVGQPELGEKLGLPGLRQLRQRIGLTAELKPLNLGETAQYIAHRLAVAGYEGPQLFTYKALKKLYHASGGIPRLINVICDKALALGYGVGARQINDQIITQVTKDWAVFGIPSTPPPSLSQQDSGQKNRRSNLLSVRAGAAFAAVSLGAVFLFSTLSPFARELLHRFSSLPVESKTFSQDGKPQISHSPVETRTQNALLPSPLEDSSAPVKTPDRRDPAPAEHEPQQGLPEQPLRASLPVLPDHSIPREVQAVSSSNIQENLEVIIQPKETLVDIALRTYGRVNATILDFMQQANPEITDVNLIKVGQRLLLPPFHPAALVQEENGTYRVHLCTLPDSAKAELEKLRLSLLRSAHTVYILPVNLTGAGEIWYRVVVGDFPSRQEAEDFFQTFPRPIKITSRLWR